MILSILLLVILIFVNGLFSATEIAFLSIDKYELSKEVKKGNKKAKKIVKLLDDESSFLSAIQIMITLSGFLASAFAISTNSFISKVTMSSSSVSLSGLHGDPIGLNAIGRISCFIQ